MKRREQRKFNKRIVSLVEKLETTIWTLAIVIAILLAIIFAMFENSKKDEISNETNESVQINVESIEVVESKQIERHVTDCDYSFIEESGLMLEKQVEMTFYLPTGNACANCEMPTENYTVAFCRDYLNMECEIYSLDGELIGSYHIDDTGYGRTEANGKGTIQNANCVDVFFENETDGREFIAKLGNEVVVRIYEKSEE